MTTLGFMSAMEITASGLTAERVRMNTLASNLANARTTRTEEGGPYRRTDPVFRAVAASERLGVGSDPHARNVFLVEVPEVRQDTTPGPLVYDPSHPDANPEGYVEMPNVSVVTEMVNLVTATRAYEAGISMMDSVKTMARSALSIGS
jgi:flagellar basal-body rod protein FlgC